MWANQVAIDKATGDSQARGRGEGGLRGGRSRHEPTHDGKELSLMGAPAGLGSRTHFLADRAEKGAKRRTPRRSTGSRPVRLWQGADQVQAPVIEFSRGQRRLIARGEAFALVGRSAGPAVVHTVLVRDSGGEPPLG